jgi:putative MATE family efflux protein
VKDLTRGPIAAHLLSQAVPVAVNNLLQVAYYLTDLYFVARLGDSQIAGLSAASTIVFVVVAMTQMTGVAASTLIAQAAGRRDQYEANRAFHQALLMSGTAGVFTLACGYVLVASYMRLVSADEATAQAGVAYLHWFLPGLAMHFAIAPMTAALRGTALIARTMTIHVISIGLNICLAPILVLGWGPAEPMGTAGAGLATTIATFVMTVLLSFNFIGQKHFVSFDRRSLCVADMGLWWRMVRIGLPVSGDLVLSFVIFSIAHALISSFGVDAQGGFGIGSRINQVALIPAMAVAFAVAPVAGQNFGARSSARLRSTFQTALLIVTVLAAASMGLCLWQSRSFMQALTTDDQVIELGAEFLQMSCWTFIPQGVVWTCASMFRGFGDTWRGWCSSASRVVTFALPAMIIASTSHMVLNDIWTLYVFSVAVQALLSFMLLRRALESMRNIETPLRAFDATMAERSSNGGSNVGSKA